MNTTQYHFTMFILQALWLKVSFTSPSGSLLPGVSGIVNAESERFHSISMFVYMIGYGIVWANRSS